MQPHGTVVIKEGAGPLTTAHLETLQAEHEAEGGSTNAKEKALADTVKFAMRFAGYLHENAHPMFLHTLRLMMLYQSNACAGCRAGTDGIAELLLIAPPSPEDLLALTGRTSWEGGVNPEAIREKLAEALDKVSQGMPLQEALASIGARVIVADFPDDEG